MKVDHIDKRERATPIKTVAESGQECGVFALVEEEGVEALNQNRDVAETEAFAMLASSSRSREDRRRPALTPTADQQFAAVATAVP